eukprot:TRINITY_DN15545_c0_g1_i1.p1 TRINITY_DN15545_c0_g1~~TRINITY_DN15545_c0_g1_i1.p1  ORF type:complete len:741 (-),score=131.96 TRINITY_DN15545_c0_g1_i1:79-2250(-)
MPSVAAPEVLIGQVPDVQDFPRSTADSSPEKDAPREPSDPVKAEGITFTDLPELPDATEEAAQNEVGGRLRHGMTPGRMLRRSIEATAEYALEIAKNDFEFDDTPSRPETGPRPTAEEDEPQSIYSKVKRASPGKSSFSKDADSATMGPIRRFARTIVHRRAFDLCIGAVIICNGFVIGLEASIKASNPVFCDEECRCTQPAAYCELTPAWITIFDTVVFAIYVLELFLRFIAFGLQGALVSNWVKFDAFLVVISTTDLILQVSRVDSDALQQIMLFRMLRLARLARMIRLMITFQTLWKLVSGLMCSAHVLFYTAVLVVILCYIFAICGLEFVQVDVALPMEHPYNQAAVGNFRDLFDAMMFGFQCFTFDSIGGVYRPLIEHRPMLFFYFMFVLLVMSITLMNLVTAIMVETSLAMAEEDKEVARVQLVAKKKKQMAQLKTMFTEMDEDGSGELSMEEINSAPEDVMDSLVEIAGTGDIATLFDMLDYDGGGTLGTDEFCEGVFRANTSTKPLELERLVKQCGEIMDNNRQVAALLRGGQEIWTSKNSNDSRRSNSEHETRTSSLKESGNQRTKLQGLQKRVEDLEGTASSMHQQTQEILQLIDERMLGVTQVPASRTATATLSSTLNSIGYNGSNGQKVKRALAVCHGKPEESKRGLRPVSATVRLERSGSPSGRSGPSSPQRPVTSHGLRAGSAPEAAALRRRIHQLEARSPLAVRAPDA